MKRYSTEEISAYIDGEARRPDQVQHVLEHDAEAARLHRAFSNVSAAIKSLPQLAPVRNTFVRDVMRSVAAVAPLRQPRWMQYGLPLAMAAALMLVTAFVGLNVTPGAPPVAVNKPAGTTDVLARIISDVDDEDAAVTMEDMVLSLASAEWFNVFADDGHLWTRQSDWTTALSGLDDDTTEAFLNLLTEYAREGQTL